MCFSTNEFPYILFINLFFWKIQDEVSFIYRVEWAAVERLSVVSFSDKYFPYPELHITFCLLAISSKARQPAWKYFAKLIGGGFPQSIKNSNFFF